MKSTNLLLTDRVGATASHDKATLRSGVMEAVYAILIKSDMMESKRSKLDRVVSILVLLSCSTAQMPSLSRWNERNC